MTALPIRLSNLDPTPELRSFGGNWPSHLRHFFSSGLERRGTEIAPNRQPGQRASMLLKSRDPLIWITLRRASSCPLNNHNGPGISNEKMPSSQQIFLSPVLTNQMI